MVGKKIVFLFILTFSSGRAQYSELLYPGKTNSDKDALDTGTINTGTNQDGSLVNVFSSTLNLFTGVPISFVRNFRGGAGFNGLPVPFNDNNLASLSENFAADYNFGLQNEDCNLSCDQLLSKYTGHPVETHEVITQDGYILNMFRIPSDGPVVLLQHGLTGSADDYVIAGPESAIVYLLAKQGYDVWLANSRGCKHSRGHITLKPSQGVFWDFSWHEVGVYDLPAMIDHTLNVTGKEKLKYIGHSQGTTAFWVMGSERPEYMDKITLMVALSPVAFNSHMKSPVIRLLAPSSGLLFAASRAFGIHELAPDNNLMRLLRWLTCGTGPLAELVCSNFIFLLSGFNPKQLNATNLPVIFTHMPSGAAAKQLVHYAQELISEKFRQFDYGPAENQKRYGSSEPPDYDISKVTAPVSLVYADEDWMTHPRDVAKLAKRLPNVVDYYKVPDKYFNHMDFVIAKDVKKLLYNRVLKILARY